MLMILSVSVAAKAGTAHVEDESGDSPPLPVCACVFGVTEARL